jgi:cell division protein FtsI (penicillin-binding protein 3)
MTKRTTRSTVEPPPVDARARTGGRDAKRRRIAIVHAALLLLAVAVLTRAAWVQLVYGRAWASIARRQQFTARDVPAPRGLILDVSGKTLATTREMVRLDVAPREVRDLRALRDALLRAGVPRDWALKSTDLGRAWVVLPGRFVAEDVAALTAMRGVYTTPVSERAYSSSPGLRPLLGRVNANGDGADGLELVLDSLLRGSAGASQLMRDVHGRQFASPTVPGQSATAGHTVVLTINGTLQDIAERTLADAVTQMGADGGDIVILDPRTGEILAIAGNRKGAVSASVTAITDPFEPGSTLKPMIAAGLLSRDRVLATDRVPSRGGSYTLHGRTIHDEPHPGATPALLSLADVIRLSSNIGIAQFADRLTTGEEYETLRDFGLGTPTGIPYTSEAAGTLRPPASWSRQSSASLAMGYELTVTPLQLALAYAVIANGGELPEPMLVKEIRTPDGRVVFHATPRVVRRVITPDVARQLRVLLSDVVERGTAVDADLATFTLAGKTGTPRRTVGGRYAPSQYNPNFVGLFPADAPQLVIVVKISSPKGQFYGGHTAAPMTKTILQAALAARDAALDLGQLSAAKHAPTTIARRVAGSDAHVRLAAAPADRPRALPAIDAPAVTAVTGTVRDTASPDTTVPPIVVDLATPATSLSRTTATRRIPDVRGLSLRDAVRSLHGAGLRVQLVGGSSAAGSATDPAPGAMVPAGTLVRLRHSR